MWHVWWWILPVVFVAIMILCVLACMFRCSAGNWKGCCGGSRDFRKR